MSEEEFLKLNKPEKVLADDRGITIYRTNNGMQSMYAFFAFERGKLFRYEEGANVNDYKFMRFQNKRSALVMGASFFKR